MLSDVLCGVGLTRWLAVDPHPDAVCDFSTFPLEYVSSVPWMLDAVSSNLPTSSVIVAPHPESTPLAEVFAIHLARPSATVLADQNTDGRTVVHGISGTVRDRAPVFVVHSIGDGNVIHAAAEALLEAGCLPKMVIVASHALVTQSALGKLRQLPLTAVFSSDSLAFPEAGSLPLHIVSLAPLLAETVDRLNSGQTLDELVFHASLQ
jgi:ribose-phosphate pyrophosphokinase